MVNNLKNKKKKKGFTLIELIIVIAIIAILAAFAIPKFGDVRKSASLKSDLANAKTIANAATYLIAEGDVVAEANGSSVVKAENGTTNGNKIANYLQNVPKTEADYKSGENNTTKGKAFFVTVDSNNNVIVTVETKAGKQLFPEN
ncbi:MULTISPECIES: prepilin-type N-terminal cleavage/methylation domain-containing protein [Clostridium]|jgi:type IV pilus assembly protein PilA|uniref:prepilin-type N-terminal cleavage/methylation domain-containing protein n=1 Tax=Clostridium TaxID=1485 RepID=UPI000DD059CE|nr:MULTISPECIES: prepilin-type N-terminal cleavage/methylation domain-containing protein [Clostridium]MBP1868111.1 type IV pilus assembly protein PilA [Clostridium tertium]MDB1935311.1 prepilin-type N-terminal cleavage/methylation domain-containing protein [Clostridium tertium]MDB1939042.1 prepilin-type N-terminal cleavage/methylation domain-containing protein [Clostridium tertium]MDB1939353.1 prepilin-type N-terminal cleavage/methylation domain-containing protein [Clostridium tertium]MDU21551